ncbi:bifunctional hydroxymethylpyrimidine kinase/phosphomethylpyrimidine kinase [Pedobacter duraquae]|uniref:hydroxymethylpyrimidine kinase n=1 Tax=Pedobacter duraquae TaxID=425511 RepID=A0A4R6IK70_9SPHI|nr:bifunctional hydroxymethylpyrimidine kinase/phosphomethylpyrimidine kinase [Pedobacter duraquae]TDO22450.1 hydroxymethylpyrimidine/phosphomethylpyrimidine kinase [Pedobacter duraquae]
MSDYVYPSVLTIAGSDSGGGAGIQADLKTFAALGCYGTSAITALTAQNTQGVSSIYGIPAGILSGQILAVLGDIRPSAIKIGMLYNKEQIESVVSALIQYPGIPVVIDPVMKATAGQNLIQEVAIPAMRDLLFPLVTLITPNLDEASILSNMTVTNEQQMQDAAQEMLKTGCYGVLVKGGHLKTETLCNVYADGAGLIRKYFSSRVETANTHGTGCTLSSAIAAYLALGEQLDMAIERAGIFVQNALIAGKNVKTGKGKGPLNHFFAPTPLIKRKLQ